MLYDLMYKDEDGKNQLASNIYYRHLKEKFEKAPKSNIDPNSLTEEELVKQGIEFLDGNKNYIPLHIQSIIKPNKKTKTQTKAT